MTAANASQPAADDRIAEGILNRSLVISDNLPVLAAMPDECVDLIYLDPPFNTDKKWSNPMEMPAEEAQGLYRDYTSMGNSVVQVGFDDRWSMDRVDKEGNPNPNWKPQWIGAIAESYPALHAVLHGAGMAQGSKLQAYLTFMAVRLLEMKRILKPTGSIYLHCDRAASHYLKAVMDSIFGMDNFLDEIVWNYGTPSGGRAAGRKPVKTHETLLVYVSNYGKHTYNKQFTPYSDKYVNDWFRHTDENGRKYRTRTRSGEIVRQYLDESPGVPLSNTWTDIKSLYGSSGWFPGNRKEITGFPTQKPLALLDRIIKTSSNEGDVVLDPFCGCATACVAAERLGRRWMGIDRGEEAYRQVIDRLQSILDEAPILLGAEDKVRYMRELPGQTDDLRVAPPVPTPRRSASHSARIQIEDNVKRLLYGLQEGYCIGCADSISYHNVHVDHVVPLSKEGSNDTWNLQLLCGYCNSKKGDRLTTQMLWDVNVMEGILVEKVRVERLWNQRKSERVGRKLVF